jgi:long-chain fatty acid transport protein
MLRHDQWRTVVLLLAVTGFEQAQGAGFALFEHSVKNLGRAYAGSGTNASEEPASLFWNPAGMSRVQGTQAQAGVVYFTVSSEFNDAGSSRTLLGATGPVTVPSTGREDDGGTEAAVPNLYIKTDVNDRLSFGMGVYSPYGLKTDYASDWIGRYHALKSELTNININPALSYRFSDQLSAGLGVSASYADSELSKAVFVVDPATAAQLPDGHTKVSGDDWAYGFNLGLLYELDAMTRFGISYRSRVEHRLEGGMTLSGMGAMSGTYASHTDLTLPETLLFSAYRRLNENWTVLSDLVWTRWSRFHEIRIEFDNGMPDDVTVEDWEDSWRMTLGTEYRHDARWTFRAGIALDQSPISNARLRTPRLPGNDRRWLSLGASFHPSDKVAIDFAYTHLFITDAAVDNTIDLAPSVAPGVFVDHLVGRYGLSADAVGLEVSVGF